MLNKKGWRLIIISLLIIGIFLETAGSVMAKGADFPMYTGSDTRGRQVLDPELNPPIKFKGKFKIGWSVSQTIAVGDYFYAVAAVQDSNNLFGLPRGTYFYKLPVDFPFFKPSDSSSYIKNTLLENGARVTRLGGFSKTYSHPTWSSQEKMFYVAAGNNVISLNQNMGVVNRYGVGARIVSPPHILPNGLLTIGSGDQGFHVVKGMNTGGNITANRYKISNHPKAVVTGATTAFPGTNDLAIALNYKDTSMKAPMGRFAIHNRPGNGHSSIGVTPKWMFVADNGLATNPVFKDSHIYVNSKFGDVYKLNASNGKVVWNTKIPDVALINNSMAIDSTQIYIPVRKPGKVVAINRSSGRISFTAAQGKTAGGTPVDPGTTVGRDIGNDVTYWRTADRRNLLLYGDVSGQLIFLDTNGRRSNVAFDHNSNTVTKSSIKATSDRSVPPDWQLQGQGVATEPLIAKKHLIFGVNTSNNMGELWFYSVGNQEDVYVDSVQGGTYKRGQRVLTEVVVGSKEFSEKILTPVVRFYRDGQLIDQKRVKIEKGKKTKVFFMWTADGKESGELKATINLPSEFDEVDYSNNTKTSKYKITKAPGGEIGMCLPNEIDDSGISKTERYCGLYGCYTINYYEYLAEQSTPSYPNRIRAGYGFTFTSFSMYVDEANIYTGPKKSEATFKGKAVDHIPQNFKLERTALEKGEGFEIADWDLPKTFVEEYAGRVFHNKNDSRIDSNENVIEGGRKYYTHFKEKDGVIPYKVVASQAGKNGLVTCNTYSVDVKGTPYDDYVRRDVIPEHPFIDSQIGFNWKSDVEKVKMLAEYYQSKLKSDSNDAEYELNHELVDELKETEEEELTKSSAKEFQSKYKK